MRRLLVSLTLCVVGSIGAGRPARADIYVVVQNANPQRALTPKEAVDLFMGRNRAFANGEPALPFDLPRGSAERGAFYQALTGMSAAQVNSYWARLMFTGKTMPPLPVAGEVAMVETVRRHPGAIGYLSHEPTDRTVRTVLVLKEAAASGVE